MITLYQLDKNAWFTGETMRINDDAGYIRGTGGWADIAPPALAEGEFAVFLGNDWIITRNPSPTPIEPVVELVNEPAQSGEGPTVI
jgi:hypothetical protein